MSPMLQVLLCLGLCLGWRIKAQNCEFFPSPKDPWPHSLCVSFCLSFFPNCPTQYCSIPWGSSYSQGRTDWRAGIAYWGDSGKSRCERQGQHQERRSSAIPGSDIFLDQLSKPSLWAKPGTLMPKGKPVTCWCQGSPEAVGYRLEKEGTHWYTMSSSNGSKASFFLGEMRTETSGNYRCQYWTSSGCSELSDSLILIMTGQCDKPVLSAKPSSVVVPGENVTLHCNSSYGIDNFMMSKDQGDEVTPQKTWTIQATFSLPAVKAADGGTYQCYSACSYYSYEWSVPSDPLVLRVTETPEDHSLSVPREPDSTNLVTLSPKHSDLMFGLPRLTASILMGTLAVVILLLLILTFLLLRRCGQHQSRLKSKGKEAEIRETLRRCHCEGRQTEEVRQEDAVALKRDDTQEVTYAQLNLKSLKSGIKPPSPSVPVEPTVYATFT